MSQAKSYLSISALEFLTGDPIRRVGGMHLVPCEFEPFQSDGGAERSDAAPARWRRPFLAVARRNRKRMGDLRVDCGVRRGLDAFSDDRLLSGDLHPDVLETWSVGRSLPGATPNTRR
jgi:hypothetical protein